MSKQRQDEYKCPLEVTMEIIGGKYKGVIIGHLIDKTLRYNELQKLISHATPKMLIQQLKELEADGIIQRKLYPVVPPKTEYSLTERGKRLIPSIIELNKWGLAYLKEMDIPCKYKEEFLLKQPLGWEKPVAVPTFTSFHLINVEYFQFLGKI